MAASNRVTKWLWEQRDSVRLAYALQLGLRVASSLLGLIWFRLLNHAMGEKVMGLHLAFQKVVTLGGLGDLGMGGAVAIRTGQYLGKKNQDDLAKFLASARSFFLLLALAAGIGTIVLSPWLPHWLGFKEAPGAGSRTMLFTVGALLIVGVLLSSYFANLNYACGNVTWPVLPAFILLQFGLLGHWLLARHGEPLWIQYLPYVGGAAAGLWLTRFYVHVSHPSLAGLLPLKLDWRVAVTLFESSFWIYLCSLGNAIYRSTDALVINAGFPLGTLTAYEGNYRFCELSVFLALTASFVSLPKITQWLASPAVADQDRVRREMRRLNQFQTVLGCGLALAYLGGNNLFMKIWWLGDSHPVLPAPLLLQMAFAFNVAITASADAGIQLSLRSGDKGLRAIGTVIGLTGLLKLGLSLAAMKFGSLVGIALATVVTQSVLSLVASAYLCRHLKVGWWTWASRAWLLPVAAISLAAWLRMALPDTLPWVATLGGVYAVFLLAIAWALGVNRAFIRDELAIVRSFIRK